MKKNYIVTAAVLSMILTSTAIVISNSTGAPAGRSGSPGDNGLTCAQGCHSGGAVANQFTNIEVTQNGTPVSEYDLNEIYDVAVTVDDGGLTAQRYGFQLTVEDPDGDKVGTLISPDNTTQITGFGGTHVTHTFTSNTPSTPGSQTWNFQWQAPSEGVLDLMMYAVGLCANGNGTNGGDVVTPVASVVLSRAPMGLFETDFNVSVFPNPAADFIQIETNIQLETSFDLVDVHGREILSGALHGGKSEVDVSDLSAGTYFLRIAEINKVKTLVIE